MELWLDERYEFLRTYVTRSVKEAEKTNVADEMFAAQKRRLRSWIPLSDSIVLPVIRTLLVHPPQNPPHIFLVRTESARYLARPFHSSHLRNTLRNTPRYCPPPPSSPPP
ncbi:hypothetical protein AB6A40_006504 [Gnathostoma spinigerum]|uniref:Uncharacterized protein n=1 Tax=Gnathostoma spinigerum TaxID=75299 RepID=A0ABD6EJR4_9BILA